MKDKLLKLLENSYAPYSHMNFACIVETKNGNFYEGVNIENASYGATVCAERNAIFNAVSHGEKEFKTLYLIRPYLPKTVEKNMRSKSLTLQKAIDKKKNTNN